MVLATPHAPGSPHLAVYYATDCRLSGGPARPAVATDIPIAADADAGAYLLARLQWAVFVRHVRGHHTAAVAALASAPSPH